MARIEGMGLGARHGMIAVLGMGLVLSACGGSDPTTGAGAPRDTVFSRINAAGTSPDEFAVLTSKPLVVNEEVLSQPLPAPTPGGRNRADLSPRADALVALGGGAQAPSRDIQALVAAGGVAPRPGIRAELAAIDAETRDPDSLRLFVRWFQDDQESALYGDEILDAAAEMERLRRAGIETSAAPPEQP